MEHSEELGKMSLVELNALRTVVDGLILSETAKIQPKRLSHKICLTLDGDLVFTRSHYNDAFVKKARDLRGVWNAGMWAFPVSVLEHVKAAMLACYGVTGQQPYEVCTLLVRGFDDRQPTGGVELFGRTIAKAFGRDSGANLGDGIFLLEGKVKSGGSVKNWCTEVINATFEIHDFPVAAVANEVPDSFLADGTVEVI